MYSGGRNPIEYHREKIKRELESERIGRERKEFIDEMVNEDRAPHLSDFRNKRDWATAKRIFIKSDAWRNIRKEVFQKYGKQCLKCGSFSRIEVDHIKPVYHFPALRLDLNNLQPLCHDCNSVKGTKSDDYRKKPI
jgi:5-methylcytosine-specific restriction endonuclease McrA